MTMQYSRRSILAGGGMLAAAMTLPLGRVMAAAAEALPKIPIPPPIGSAERVHRLARAKEMMRAQGIGAVLVESGPSLDYYTGVQWWRSERQLPGTTIVNANPVVRAQIGRAHV